MKIFFSAIRKKLGKKTIFSFLLVAAITCIFGTPLNVPKHTTVRALQFPIMDLSKGVARGMCNQKSVIVTSLYLASLLNWDVLLPELKSPVNCADLDPACYKYESFKQVPFDLLYDLEYFIHAVNANFGLKVYTDASKIPRGYQRLPQDLDPCPNVCRGSYDSFVDLYSDIRGPFLVQGPGISSAFIDSDSHFSGVGVAISSLRPARTIASRALRMVEASKGQRIVAVHWRYEKDITRKHDNTGSESVFVDKISKSLQKRFKTDEAFVLFLVGGVTKPFSIGIDSLQKAFPRMRVLSKSSIDTEVNEVTFFDASVDYEVAVMADVFYGHPISSFSAFVAADRFQLSSGKKKTILFPSLSTQDSCFSSIFTGNQQMHWQYELSLPLQRCAVPDPCHLFFMAAGLSRYLIPEDRILFCPYKTLEYHPSTINNCTGTTRKFFLCNLQRMLMIFQNEISVPDAFLREDET